MKGLRTTTLSSVLLSAFAALAAPQVMAGVTDKDIEADGKTTTSDAVVGHGHGRPALQPARQDQCQERQEPGSGLVVLLRRRKAARPGIAAADRQRQDVRDRLPTRACTRSTPRPAKLWQYEHRLPDGIMPCCDVMNRGAAVYDNLVIFARWTPSWSRLTRTPARSCGRKRSTTTRRATRTPLRRSSPRACC
jgi:alcohol dehydrogenase (cytochrome c)